MLLSETCKWTLFVPNILVVSLLLLGHTAVALRPSSSMFPLEIFGTQNVDAATSNSQWQQTILELDHDELRYSNSSFPGDETGNSPFFYCPESNPDTDLFQISKIVLNPNPPRINYVFVFHAHGYFREAIIDWDIPFRVRTTVRNEDRDGINFTIERDFCDFVDMMEMDGKSTICPPFQGNGTIHKFEFVDFGISEANYSVKIDVTGNNKRVFCVQAWFDLHHGEFSTVTGSAELPQVG